MSNRQWLKQRIPRQLHRPVRLVEALLRRWRIWFAIMFSLRGIGAADKKTLLTSFLSGLLRAGRGLGEWRDPVLLRDARVMVSGVGEFRVRAHSDDLWHTLPSREQAITDTVTALLQPGDCFVDAGANIGFYSVLAARSIGSTGQVVAFEMMPDTAALLREHLQLNACHQASVVERALSDRVGVTVAAQVSRGKFGQATIAGAADPDAAVDIVPVQSTTLDAALADIAEIRLMKLDLEGAEFLALQGASEVLARTRTLIYECWEDDPTLDGLLYAQGFEVRKLDGRNNLATR